MAVSPGDGVFTTLPFDGERRVLDPAWQFERLAEHAERLGIALPAELVRVVIARLPAAVEAWMTAVVDGSGSPADESGAVGGAVPSALQPPALLRVAVSRRGEVELTVRTPFPIRDACEVAAVAHPAPRFAARIAGTKHAAWQPYEEARRHAAAAGAEMALLVVDDAIVDGDRAAPVLLDSDGVAFHAAPEQGGVESLTLRAVASAVIAAGIPMRPARLTRDMVARCREMVVVGSGVGVARIFDIDGQPVGDAAPGALYGALASAQAERLVSGWTGLDEVVA